MKEENRNCIIGLVSFCLQYKVELRILRIRSVSKNEQVATRFYNPKMCAESLIRCGGNCTNRSPGFAVNMKLNIKRTNKTYNWNIRQDRNMSLSVGRATKQARHVLYLHRCTSFAVKLCWNWFDSMLLESGKIQVDISKAAEQTWAPQVAGHSIRWRGSCWESLNCFHQFLFLCGPRFGLSVSSQFSVLPCSQLK